MMTKPNTIATIPIGLEQLGRRAYEPVWRSMQEYTEKREPNWPDLIWSVEHDPVYTLGLNGDPRHRLQQSAIPMIQVDRGGQITYHGPGQLVLYFLFDLKRRQIGIKSMVHLLEEAVIRYLNQYDIDGHRIDNAPGVYVKNQKIAALGLRIKRKGCYHGLSLNVDMDLTPFSAINPCGHEHLQVTQLKALGGPGHLDQVSEEMNQILLSLFNQN